MIDHGLCISEHFVMDALDEQHRPEFHWGGDDSRLLGEDRFLQQVVAQTDKIVTVKISLEELLTSVAVEFEIDIADLCDPGRKRSFAEARGVAAWLVSETEHIHWRNWSSVCTEILRH